MTNDDDERAFLAVTSEGLEIPPPYLQTEEAVTIRTPQTTVGLSSGVPVSPYPLVSPMQFRDAKTYRHPHLAPDSVEFERESEETPTVYPVEAEWPEEGLQTKPSGRKDDGRDTRGP